MLCTLVCGMGGFFPNLHCINIPNSLLVDREINFMFHQKGYTINMQEKQNKQKQNYVTFQLLFCNCGLKLGTNVAGW